MPQITSFLAHEALHTKIVTVAFGFETFEIVLQSPAIIFMTAILPLYFIADFIQCLGLQLESFASSIYFLQ